LVSFACLAFMSGIVLLLLSGVRGFGGCGESSDW
jgi:hypothetical protein